MRYTAIAVMALLVAQSAACGLAGSEIIMVEPSEPVPGDHPVQISFEFLVLSDAASTEQIRYIWIWFPDGLVPHESTMWYEEIEPGRPAVAMRLQQQGIAEWRISDFFVEPMYVGESLRIGVTAIMYPRPPSTWAELTWMLQGESWTTIHGHLNVYTTPVECESWGRVKALYRDN